MTNKEPIRLSIAGYGQRALRIVKSRPYGKLVGDCYTTGNVALLASGTLGAHTPIIPAPQLLWPQEPFIV